MKSRSPLLSLWLINAALAVLLLVWWLLFNQSRWTPPAPLQPDYSSVLQGAVLPGELRRGDYPAITKAPLFEPDRKWPEPLPPKPVEAPPPEAPPPNALDGVRVLGVYGRQGGGMVIFEVDGKSYRLRQGQTYEGWTLAEIDRLSLRFTHPSHPERVLKLERRRPGEEATAAPPSPPAAQNASPQRPRIIPRMRVAPRPTSG